MRVKFLTKILVVATCLSSLNLQSEEPLPETTQNTTLEPRQIPARTIPVPSTASLQLQELDARLINTQPAIAPKNQFEWYALIAYMTKLHANIPFENAKKLFPVTTKEGTFGSVRIYTAAPEIIPNENKDLVLLYIHGGGYILYGGEDALPEAMAIAHYGKFKVVAADYRMPPQHPFPAALDDSVEVYKELLKTYKPKNIGIFGTSAGGGLAASLVLKLHELKLPLPGVLGLGTPWADLTKTGDTYFTNQDVDNVLVQYEGIMEATAKLYAGDHDLKDPYISPIYGEYTKEFPPTIFTSGTRDLFLSNTVRLFRKMRQAGVKTELQVFEGAPHAFHVIAIDSPEAKEAYQEMVIFFKEHLGK